MSIKTFLLCSAVVCVGAFVLATEKKEDYGPVVGIDLGTTYSWLVNMLSFFIVLFFSFWLVTLLITFLSPSMQCWYLQEWTC